MGSVAVILCPPVAVKRAASPVCRGPTPSRVTAPRGRNRCRNGAWGGPVGKRTDVIAGATGVRRGHTLEVMTREEIEKAFGDEGLSPHSWSNHANYFYDAHSHDYAKVLYCVRGEVTFHLSDGDVVLRAGQRVEIPAGTRHAATVGSDGVECMEAPKYRRG